jgi:hypothetical protein
MTRKLPGQAQRKADDAPFVEALAAAEAGEVSRARALLERVYATPDEESRWEVLYLAAWALLHADPESDDDGDGDDEDRLMPSALRSPERDGIRFVESTSSEALSDAARLLERAIVTSPPSATRPLQLLAAVRERQDDQVAAACLTLRAASVDVSDTTTISACITQVGAALTRIASMDVDAIVPAVKQLVDGIDQSFLPEVLAPELKAEVYLAGAIRLARSRHAREAEELLRCAEDCQATLPELKRLGSARSRSLRDEVLLAGLDVEGSVVQRIFETLDLLTGRLGHAATPSGPRAVLLFGPSGTGKTHVVRAYAARHPEAIYRKARMDQLLGKYVGESEKAVSAFLREVAIGSAGGIAFLDEVDALGSARDSSDGNWRAALVGHVLAEIDEFKERATHAALVGGTNRIWAIDHAVLRRFDEIILMPLPSVEVRRDLFAALASHAKLDFPSSVFDELAEESEGTTPSDCSAAFSNVQARFGALDGGEFVARIRESLVERRVSNHLSTWVARSAEKLAAEGFTDLLGRLHELYSEATRRPTIRIEAQRATTFAPGASWHLSFMSNRIR